MKARLFFLIFILSFVVYSCDDSTPPPVQLEVSESSFDNISSSGLPLAITITCNSKWTATGSDLWCSPSVQEGRGNYSLNILVEANLNSTERTGTVNITSEGTTRSIRITQQAGENINIETFHYKIPVIFHVLYKDKADVLQYVSQQRLSEILQTINKLYKDEGKSVDMNLEFTLAETSPDGNRLTTPGVEYIEWKEEYPIDCGKFMSDNSGKYVPLLWEPNKYINVMVYNFKPDSPTMTTLGISHLPYSTKGSNYLVGLNETDYSYITKENLKFPYCLSINSLFINAQSTESTYSTADVVVTTAHELGHYLGLHHVFSEDKNGAIIDDCRDTDYCEDTPSYNKIQYDVEYDWAMAGNVPEDKIYKYLLQRTNCNNLQFTSYNMMDYAFSYSNQFTVNQRNRVRHVLTYSPLIPGPKREQASTRSAPTGVLDLPIRTIK